MREIRLEPEAAADVREAHLWYERNEPGLGVRFEARVEEACAWISENTALCREWRPGVRKYGVKVFPFAIYFRELGDEIRILAVLHGARDPRIVEDRLGGDA